MKKVFDIQGSKVLFMDCTAICKTLGKTERVKAVFVREEEREGVIFNVVLPETKKDAEFMLWNEWVDEYYRTVETVEN